MQISIRRNKENLRPISVVCFAGIKLNSNLLEVQHALFWNYYERYRVNNIDCPLFRERERERERGVSMRCTLNFFYIYSISFYLALIVKTCGRKCCLNFRHNHGVIACSRFIQPNQKEYYL